MSTRYCIIPLGTRAGWYSSVTYIPYERNDHPMFCLIMSLLALAVTAVTPATAGREGWEQELDSGARQGTGFGCKYWLVFRCFEPFIECTYCVNGAMQMTDFLFPFLQAGKLASNGHFTVICENIEKLLAA